MVKKNYSNSVTIATNNQPKPSRYKQIQFFIYNIFNSSDKNNWVSMIDDWAITFVVIINVNLMLFSTVKPLYNIVPKFFDYTELICTMIFCVEYFLKLWSAGAMPKYQGWKGRIKYMITFWMVLDFLVIAPTLLPFLIGADLRIIQPIKIMRIFKLGRFSSATSMYVRAFKSHKKEILIAATFSLVVMLTMGMILYHVEAQAQPDKMQSAFDALWLTNATLTTVGYGDTYPVTPWGRIVAMIGAIGGVGFFGFPWLIYSAALMGEIIRAPQEHWVSCPHCRRTHRVKI